MGKGGVEWSGGRLEEMERRHSTQVGRNIDFASSRRMGGDDPASKGTLRVLILTFQTDFDPETHRKRNG